MEKLKIAITQGNYDAATQELSGKIIEDPAMLELCTPVVYKAGQEEAALRDLDAGKVDALVLAPTNGSAKCPDNAVEIIVTEKTHIMPVAEEPTAEDVIKLRDILERDFDLRSPRIAIVQETGMQNPDIASQVTEEHGINPYGPYTSEQILAEDTAIHFDGIIVRGKELMQRIVAEVSQEAPVCYFAGREAVVTGICQPNRTEETEEGVADVSWLTHPFYTAIDVIRNRAFYDEARQDILPKLFRDKRDERKKDETAQANNKTDNTETVS